MKRTLLFVLAASFSLASKSQNSNLLKQKRQLPFNQNGIYHNDNYVSKTPETPSNYTPSAPAPNETLIGITKYDLQTNTSLPRRIVDFGDGTMAATWTYSVDNNFASRGTGYVYYDGTSWSTAPSTGADQVESTRSGWPTLAKLGANGEIISSHGNSIAQIVLNKRNNKGTGSWNENFLSLGPKTILWPRIATGGQDGETVHLIGRNDPNDTNTDTEFGMTGVLFYSMSKDGGASWDISNVQIPGLDSTNFAGIGADDYAIDAQGNTVVVAHGGIGEGVSLFRSEDGGYTWTVKWAMIPAVHRFDETRHTIIDTAAGDVPTGIEQALAPMPSADGSVGVVLDENGVAHVTFGYQEITNSDITDGVLGYFPAMNGIMYWNDSMEEDTYFQIAGAPDMNGNGFLDIATDNTGAGVFGNYRFFGLAHSPQIGVNTDGCMYMVYAAIADTLYEFFDPTRANLRHIFGIKSCDGGCTWSEPIDLTPHTAEPYFECVYPAIPRRLNGDVNFIYQKDDYTSVYLNNPNQGSTPHPVHENEIIFVNVPTTDFSNEIAACYVGIEATTEICEGEDAEIKASCGTAFNWSTGETSQSITINTQDTYAVTISTACGQDSIVSVVIGGPTPMATTISGVDATCFGLANGSATINVSGGDTPYMYLWNDNSMQTTANALNLMAGTYSVSISDDNGCTKMESITLSEPNEMMVSYSTVDANCTNNDGEATVTAFGTSPFTYQWSNGNVNSTATGLVAGIHTVSVYDANNCEKEESITVSSVNLLSISATASNTSACGLSDGSASVSVLSGASPYMYMWSDGQTTTLATGLIADAYTIEVIDNNGCVDETLTIIGNNNSLLSITVTSTTDALCFGSATGSASVAATGSTAYTFEWSDNNMQTTTTATGLAAGLYSIKVTDVSNCVAIETITISEPTQLSSMESSVDASCFNGNDGYAEINVSGGTSPYSYLWSNGMTTSNITTSANSFNITITDGNGCKDFTTVTVSEPTQVSAAISNTISSCIGGATGSATAIASGGTSPYSYNWVNNSGATGTGLSAGIYTVTVTDGNTCIGIADVTITEVTELYASTTDIDPTCFGNSDGSMKVTPVGGSAPYTYQWQGLTETSDIATGLADGTYYVTIQDANGCLGTISGTLTEPTQLDVSVQFYDDANNGSVDLNITASGGTPSYTYNWNTPSGNTNSEDLTNVNVQGDYTVTVTDSNGCTKSKTFTVAGVVSAQELISGTTVNVFPNPSEGKIFVSFDSATDNYTIEIVNMLGQVIAHSKVNANVKTYEFDLNVEAGTYFVNISNNSEISTHKVIVK